ncbi:MAG: CPBP family intramembrane metalloprotease [Anaerolineae bacterium]|nr:CPBP family intramembrane metalloprotease [Anaerolineae bacterium]
MNNSLPNSNSPNALRTRVSQGLIPRWAPVLLLLARPALALLAQNLALLLFRCLGVTMPAVAVRHWWTVYGSLIDLGCLGLLFWLLRREGLYLRDLIGFDKHKLKTDILLGIGIFVVVFPLSVGGGGVVGNLIAYGALQPTYPEAGFIRTLPLAAVLYSRFFWWVLWSFTEELTFQGYSLPRLQVVTGSTWLAVALVSFGWAIQHSFLPWIDPRHALYMFIAFLPLTVAMQALYLRVRRLPPLIVGHWLMDLTSVLFLLQVA